jgi:hypothetical protein
MSFEKADIIIAKEIEKSILQNNNIEILDEYRFPVKTKQNTIAYYTINSSKKEKIIALKENEINIALLKFQINNGNIIINGIQGLKQDKIKTPSNWFEKLLDPFIASCLTVYKDPKLLSERLEYYDLKNLKKELLRKKILEISTNQLIKINPNNILIQQNKKEIEIIDRKIKTIKMIRDKYFTEDGRLNLKRERIKRIILKYAQHIKNRKIKYNKYKRIIKKRKENFKKKIR